MGEPFDLYRTAVVLFGFLIATIGRALTTVDPVQKAALLTPGKFLSTPGLWIALAFAAAFLGAAIWLRRYREPL